MQILGSGEALHKSFNRALRPLAIIGAVGGFIADIIQPLGAFGLWIAALSFLGAVAALAWILVLRRRAGQSVPDTSAAGRALYLCTSRW